MKNIIKTFIITILFSITLNAQIGINTEKTEGYMLYIDSKSNNEQKDLSDSEKEADDVVIDSNGNFGIGTSKPQAKLHIGNIQAGEDSVRLMKVVYSSKDPGFEGGQILRSDADGYGYWGTPYEPFAQMHEDESMLDGVTIDFTNNANARFYYTGNYIDLYPGKWSLLYNFKISTTSNSSINHRGFIKFSLITQEEFDELQSNPDFLPPEERIESAGLAIGTSVMLNDTFKGRAIINNTNYDVDGANTTTRYYLVAGGIEITSAMALGLNVSGQFVRTGGSSYQSSITAIRVPEYIDKLRYKN